MNIVLRIKNIRSSTDKILNLDLFFKLSKMKLANTLINLTLIVTLCNTLDSNIWRS